MEEPPQNDPATPASPTSTTSEAPSLRPSALPKPSGLKPPTKIGRLCSNSAPKPAVPISPRSDGGSTDTLRKLSDDYSRKHLSDLVEAEEDGEVSYNLPSDRTTRPHRKASTSSTYSLTSMDALWEKHPRRLSEAGLRRSSDHSVVLTEDTDGFIIGDRVWVGGTKPGQIAYIGETQFAPGEWAGIVLDDPIGKNDGSVAGVRYFQCADKRGVFSRLTRLTRAPLPHHDASPISDGGSVFDRPPSGMSRSRRALSPNGSVRSFVSSKMNASVTTSGGNGELRLGDRVIISSSRGSKAGTLRYVGVTDFASGVWAGVELDDPLGKNDGSVDGKSYFECSPRFGLFAPIGKVSRSPSNRKPGACAIHNNGRATPVRRSNSRESLTSLGTSVASSRGGVRLGATLGSAQRLGGPRASSTPVSAKNALQEMLREKQIHLERLMKERELERSDVAKLALQADRAETALSQLKKDAAQTIAENEKLKLELDKIMKLLDDERQKVDDLMFRNEEENINKEDYNKYKEEMEKMKAAMEQRIRELEAESALQAARADAASGTVRALEEQRTTELSNIHEQHREELSAAQTLSTELQKLLDEAYALLKEKDNEKDSIGKSMTEELSKVKAESERALNDAKSKLSIAQTEFETQMSVLNAKLQVSETKLESEKQLTEKLNKESSQTIIDLNTKISQLQAALDDKTHELNKVSGTTKECELNLNKDITKLKMELSAKILDVEELTEANKKYERSCKSLENEISRVKEEFSTKVNEYETLLNEISQQNDQSRHTILQLEGNLSSKSKEYEKLLATSSEANVSSEKVIMDYKQTIHERDKEIIKLKNNYEEANADFNIKQSKIAEEYKKEIEKRNDRIEQLLKEIEEHKQSVEKGKLEIDTLNSQFNVNIDELKALKTQNDELKKTVEELTKVNSDLKNKISSMELEIGELSRQVVSNKEQCEELQNAKEKIENEYLNLTGQTTDSNEQFNKLTQHLKETEKELREIKDKHRESVNIFGRNEQELKQQIFKIQEEYSVERSQLMQTINNASEKSKADEFKLSEYESQLNEFKEKIKNLEISHDKLTDENVILKSNVDVLNNKEAELSSEFHNIKKELESSIDKYKAEISILKVEGDSSEMKLKEKVDQLIEAQNDLNNKLEESRKQEDILQKVIDDMTKHYNMQKNQYEKEREEDQLMLVAAKEETNSHKLQDAKLKELLQEQENSVKELTLKLGMYDVDIKANSDILSEKDRQLELINGEVRKINESKKEFEDKANEYRLELTELQQKYDAMVADSTVGDTRLKEQLQQTERLKSDIASLIQEKSNVEKTHRELSAELNKIQLDHTDINKKLQEQIILNTELKKVIEEKETIMKNQSDKSESELSTMKKLEQELIQLKQEVEHKNVEIGEKAKELEKLNNLLNCNNSEIHKELKLLKEEKNTLCNKHKKEVEAMNKTLTDLQAQISNQQNHHEEVQQSKAKVIELQVLLEKSEKDIKQLNNINEGQKSNYEDLNKQLQSQYDELKKESKRSKTDLKNRLIEYEKELQESKNKLQAENSKRDELQQKIDQSENRVLELSNKIELLMLEQNTNIDKDDRLEKLTVELQAARKNNSDMVATVGSKEMLLAKVNADLETKAKDLKNKENIICKLKEDLKNQIVKTEVAEREKAQLKKELTSRPKDIHMKENNEKTIGPEGDSQKLLEEKEIVDGQVSFLNSVIVDMQRKNEQLMARVQALESGATSPEPPLYNGRKPRAVAPRLFCDICDVFDAHDTDECPKQSAAPDQPALRRAPPPPREYCDICEVFGHATENCDEEETF